MCANAVPENSRLEWRRSHNVVLLDPTPLAAKPTRYEVVLLDPVTVVGQRSVSLWAAGNVHIPARGMRYLAASRGMHRGSSLFTVSGCKCGPGGGL